MVKKELLNKMENIVKRYVKHYKSDFYDYDLHELKKENEKKYVWIVRESGTFLLDIGKLKNPEKENDGTRIIYNYYLDDNRYYKVDLKKGSIKKYNPIELNEANIINL